MSHHQSVPSHVSLKGIALVSCHTSNWVGPWMFTRSNCVKLHLTSSQVHPPTLPINYVVTLGLALWAGPGGCVAKVQGRQPRPPCFPPEVRGNAMVWGEELGDRASNSPQAGSQSLPPPSHDITSHYQKKKKTRTSLQHSPNPISHVAT